MLDVDHDAFKTKMDERKASLEIVNWDGDSGPNTPVDNRSTPPPPPAPTPSSRTLSYDEDSEPDSDCPVPPPGFKGVKTNISTMTPLCHDSDLAQLNNWDGHVQLV
jgi:hypothetical protein